MRRILVAAGVCLLLAACGTKPSEEAPAVRTAETQPTVEVAEPAPTTAATSTTTPADPLAELLPEGHRAGAAIEVGGVSIVPILNPGAPTETEYLTLHEAMEANLCVVSDRKTVNALLLTNKAEKPLFLMIGDLVLGGDQDRIMAESMVIEAGETDVAVPVFCVEPHRWSAEPGKDKSGPSLFYSRPDARQVDVNVKGAAVKTASQGMVWEAVGEVNQALSVEENAGGSFRSTFDDEATAKKLDELYDEAKAASNADTVGYAVMREGELVAMDLFDSKGLCAKLSEQLLRSYLVTALSGEVPATRRTNQYVQHQGLQDTELADYEDWLSTSRRTPRTTEDTAVYTALAEVHIALFFEGTALDTVLEKLRTGGRINVVRDDEIDGEQEISLDYGDVTLRQAFNLVANQLGVSWEVRDGAVYIGAVDPAPGVRTVDVNKETETTREVRAGAIEYTCKDKKRDTPVHRSFLKR